MDVLGPVFRGRHSLIAAALVTALSVLPVASASACPEGSALCESEQAGRRGVAGGVVDAVPRGASEAVRNAVKAIKCADPLRAHKRCPQPEPEPPPAEPDVPADTASPSPETQTPSVRPQPVAVPVAVRRPAPTRPVAASIKPAVSTPAPPAVVKVLRVPVFLTSEEVAAAASAGVGLAAAVAVVLAWWLPARRRRQRAIASEYGKLASTLVSNLSHELFTPLTPVKGYATMLQHTALPPSQVQQFAGEMAGASDRLHRVLDSMVAFAEVSAGADARADIVDTGVLVHQSVARVHATEAHTIAVDVAHDVPSMRANERLLGLAVEALVDNAVKFSPAGGVVEVDVAVGSGAHGREVRIRVTDEGVGMTAEELRLAREAFRQVDPSNTRRFGGLGLGLALADRVARLHRGRLDITSRPGHGSTFALSIPLSPAELPSRDEGIAAATA